MMRILIADPDIQARMAFQKYLGTFGDCQTVDTSEALMNVFREAAASHDERFDLVIMDGNLENVESLFGDLRMIEWEANVQRQEGATMVFTGTMVEWMRVSGILCDSCDTFIAKPLKRELLYTAMANLGFEHFRKKTPQAVYDQIIRKFLSQGGEVLALAEDASFYTLLKRSMESLLETDGTLLYFTDPDSVSSHICAPIREDTELILFIARTIKDKLTTEYINRFRNEHHRMRVIMLTNEIEDFNIAYMHDVDADSVLTMPASLNNIFEKMANAIHPPARLQYLLQEARVALGRGNHTQALNHLEEALNLKPYSPGVLLLKGDVMREMGNTDEAIKAYEEAHMSSSLFLDPLKRLAEIHQETSQEAALPYLEKLDQISPRNPRRKVDIGNAKLDTHGIETSRRYYDAGIALAKKESGRLVDELVNVISETLRFRFPKVAISYIDDLIKGKRGKYTEEDVETFNRKGVLLRQEGKWKEAIENYEKALQVSPHNNVLKYNLMMAHMEGRDFRAALQVANEIMATDPHFPRSSVNVAYNLACVYHRRNHLDQARQLANMALSLNAEHQPSISLKKKLHQARTK